MEAPAIINRHRRPFLLPVWLTFATFFALFVVAVVAFFVYRSATTTTVVVLARHAEKDLNSIQDPPLSAEGEQRAERLAQMFGRDGKGGIDAIYVSGARRAQQTAAPLAERLGKQTVVVPAADVKGLASRVMHEHGGGTVLVIGHSNTVPELIHDLGDVDVPPIRDDEYDTLYVLSIPSFGHASVLRMQY